MSTLIRVLVIGVIALAPGGILLLPVLAIERLWTRRNGQSRNGQAQVLVNPASDVVTGSVEC